MPTPPSKIAGGPEGWLRPTSLTSLLLLSLSACSPAKILNVTVPKAGLTIQHDIAYGTDPRQTLDIYRPTTPDPAQPVIIFFYGGSWNSGSKTIYPFVAATLARTGMVVVVPDYRVYPQVKYPDFLRDCARATAWVQAHPAQTGTGPLFLMGHSAGAYNAIMLGLDPSWLRDAGAAGPIAGLIGMAGPYDFLPITDKEIVPIFPGAGPDTQPITYAGPGAPPTLLQWGTEDRQVRPRNSQALAARLRQNGDVVRTMSYPGLGHVGLILAMAPAFQWRAPVLHDLVGFIRDVQTSGGKS